MMAPIFLKNDSLAIKLSKDAVVHIVGSMDFHVREL